MSLNNNFLNIISEDFTKLEIECSQTMSDDELDNLLTEVYSLFDVAKEDDAIHIFLKSQENDVMLEEFIYEGLSTNQEIKDEYDSYLDLYDKKDLTFSMMIYKKNSDYISVYSLKDLVKQFDLNNSLILDTLKKLTLNTNNMKNTQFELIYDKGYFYTNSLFFGDKDHIDNVQNKPNITSTSRELLLEKMNENCNFISDEISLIPYDFNILESKLSKDNEDLLKRMFNNSRNILSVIYITNYSKIENGVLSYKVEGYKRIDGNIPLDNKEYFEKKSSIYNVFDWIYTGESNIADRIEMSRNIISLHINGNILQVDEAVLPSIKSGYEIYLKENVENYINVLNQIIDLSNNLVMEKHKINNQFKNDFKNSFRAYLTFIFTTFLVNVISTGQFQNIFTREITIISYGILGISLIYYMVSLLGFNRDVEELSFLSKKNKEHYSKILNESDINKIFENNIKDESSINIWKKIKRPKYLISILWIGSIIILSIVVTTANNGEILKRFLCFLLEVIENW